MKYKKSIRECELEDLLDETVCYIEQFLNNCSHLPDSNCDETCVISTNASILINKIRKETGYYEGLRIG